MPTSFVASAVNQCNVTSNQVKPSQVKEQVVGQCVWVRCESEGLDAWAVRAYVAKKDICLARQLCQDLFGILVHEHCLLSVISSKQFNRQHSNRVHWNVDANQRGLVGSGQLCCSGCCWHSVAIPSTVPSRLVRCLFDAAAPLPRIRVSSHIDSRHCRW
jgi:hypothetical protein